ncbi:ras-like protein family member 10A, partial [Marmota marmota marmota]|uniref:ras-like protein family member 10A n=1 Tax=Marmota marmota marmota TaxID=9994 RepID=UPI002092D517
TPRLSQGFLLLPWVFLSLPTSIGGTGPARVAARSCGCVWILEQSLEQWERLESGTGIYFLKEECPDSKDWSLQDTDAFVLVYDICSPDSFDYVKALRQRIAETRPAGAPEAPILVVGNKRDRQRLRFGPRRALAALVRRGWRCGYLECSAKYNWHVLRLFRELLRCALVRARPAHPALRLQGALHPARCILM